MADLTWYSREGADQRFLTKGEAAGLAFKEEIAQGDAALGSRIDAVKATAEAALPSSTAASTYATKTEVEAVKQAIPQVPASPDLSSYATKADMQAADGALGQRIDSVSGIATAAATKAELTQYATTIAVAGTYATKESLAGYLKATDASDTYATKAQLAQAQLGGNQNAPDLAPYLKTADADVRYASKADLAKAQAGGNVDLSSYITRDVAYDVFVQRSLLDRNLELYATLEALNATALRIDALGKTISPFKPGERYYSTVTYFWPDYYQKPPNVSKWSQILKFAGSLGIVILNRNSGNWDTYDKDFDTQAKLALAAGAKRAVFYVKTQYLAATLPTGDPGRANVPDVDKYTEAYILGQIEKAKTQYGDVCQGVFLDEAINGWGAQAGRIPAYKSLIDRIRAKYGKDFLIVVNSGSNISEEMCKLDFDVCMMFEKDATAFLNEGPGTPILPDHMKAYPSTRWWAVVHGVTSDNYRKVFDKADSLGISHLYITDGQLREDPQRGGQWEPVGNPYANPPSNHIHELVVPWLKGYLPLKLEVDELRSRPRVLSLGKHVAVPAGTPAGTIIVRKEN
jgi:hypothetical protein